MKIIILFTIIALLGFVSLALMHEQAHVVVYERYGINSSISFGYENGFETNPKGSCPSEECILGNNIIDGVGYQLYAFYGLLFIGFATIIGLLEERK